MDYLNYYMTRVKGLVRQGAEYRAPCPIHHGKRLSFAVNMESGRWVCHSECGQKGGDPYELEMELTGCTYQEVKPVVAALLGVREDLDTGTNPPRPKRQPKKAQEEPSEKVTQFLGPIVATYDYHDEQGRLVYQVTRHDPKDFRQRRPKVENPDPNKKSDWVGSIAGIDRLLYHLPEVIKGPDPVWLFEGEKDVDNMRARGLNATCNSGGAGKGKFTPSMAKHLKGRLVYAVPDIDDDENLPPAAYRKGEKHMEAAADLLNAEGCRVKVVRLPNGSQTTNHDVSQYMENGGTVEALQELAEGAPYYTSDPTPAPDVPTPAGLPEDLLEMQRNYIILVGSGGFVWDHRRGCTMEISDVRHAHAADFPIWYKSSGTKRMDFEKLTFKPQGCLPDEINLFKGLKIQPDPHGCCDRLKEHLILLAGGDPEITHWLTAWLAYPLQHIGAKMRTALVVHGPQGTGKSLLFDAVKAIYAPYSDVISQNAIDYQWTGWASKKLFIVADEVLSRKEMVNTKNKLKSLITSDDIEIEEKHRTRRIEENHLNIVFLSNEDTPVIIERSDRRFMVLHVPEVQAPEYYQAIADELDNGGLAAFYHYLLHYPLNGFHPHTKPIETDAKRAIMESCLTPADRFLDAWQREELPLPFCSVPASDLFEAYRLWATVSGERFSIGNAISFGRAASKRFKTSRAYVGGKQSRVFCPVGDYNHDEASEFQVRLNAWLERQQARRI